MQSWTFKPFCMHSNNSLPFFKTGLLHIDSFSKYSDTALWHWTQSVMKCTSIKKPCKERLQWTHSKFKPFHSIVPGKSLTFMRGIPSMFPVPAKERILFPSYVQYAWNNLGNEEEWIQPVCISLIHRYGLEKPRFWQLFVHYFNCLQSYIAAPPKRSHDIVFHVHTFCLHSWVLTMTLKNSCSFFLLPNNQPQSPKQLVKPNVYYT